MYKCRLKKIIFILITILMVGTITAFADEIKESKSIDGIKATVLEILSINEKEIRGEKDSIKEQQAKVIINSGSHKGENIVIVNSIDTANVAQEYLLNKGDEILLSIEESNGKIVKGYMYEYDRHKYLLYLVVIFIVLMILIGGSKGIKSTFTLCFTVFIILKIFPMLLLRGYNPIKTAIGMSIVITVVTLLIVSGSSRKTITAIIGTSCGAAVSGIIAIVVGDLAKITGYVTEEGQMLMYIPQDIKFDYKGLLFAAILMGALGAIMDVSMSIVSAMNEINEANPEMSATSLMRAGMSVGKDIMGTMSNTLILAYVGASLQSLILLFAYKISFIDIINQPTIATEILRALSGSIGLISSIPITVICFGLIRKRVPSKSYGRLIRNIQNID
ncbi:YibE/F family protein [Clostridium sp. MB40-C1]|uniref:YibE/F family protein n=1 Tax=Clostridium sp. MB40-C1 TaxID=3070996 RepID=UPI0027E0A061|nr:YibE/F family protein [Clostridium sp. MB40-C1]WMJ81025.1 YibE/F family protein [Clostridium sp. MB40-C1]